MVDLFFWLLSNVSTFSTAFFQIVFESNPKKIMERSMNYRHDRHFFFICCGFLLFCFSATLKWDDDPVLSQCFQSAGDKTASKRVGLVSTSRPLKQLQHRFNGQLLFFFPFYFPSPSHVCCVLDQLPALLEERVRPSGGGGPGDLCSPQV